MRGLQIREKRQERFHEARMQRSKAATVAADRRELARDVATVRSPPRELLVLLRYHPLSS